MADNDFKYMIQDISNIYIGARSTYGELAENEELPHKLREVIVRIFLKEVAEDTTPENHLFYLTKDSASYRAMKKMRTQFRMSVWQEADGKKRKKPGYVNREYTLDEVVDSEELHRKKDTIVVEEMHISKLGLAMVVV
ncbi:MAG TPA: hypothetical protein H9717_08630 [Candidatus Eisenbergiella merdipullorum]|uniref:Uncharacterized protein n=1 Tax=Candidatus Eisenbergiella merdipullorum TaxID=2838553 RepID=A0A9D2I7B6_9FIRM|nr:hypothetical protein [Candidatus Eisenbergiella merdipullorum]